MSRPLWLQYCQTACWDEPRKGPWKGRIELPGVDPLGDRCNNVGAAARLMAGRAIQVVRVEPSQDAGPVQKVMHQGVNGDHAAADLGPVDHLTSVPVPTR